MRKLIDIKADRAAEDNSADLDYAYSRNKDPSLSFELAFSGEDDPVLDYDKAQFVVLPNIKYSAMDTKEALKDSNNSRPLE